MPPSKLKQCGDEEERHLRRLATYRQYRHRHLDQCREKTRERMARLRASPTEAARARHREAQRRYREKYREEIAHRARRAATRRNAEAGKQTRLRPNARHYWSDPEADSESGDSDDGEDGW